MDNVILCVYITDTGGWSLAQSSYFRMQFIILIYVVWNETTKLQKYT